jgi:hypothetical protein
MNKSYNQLGLGSEFTLICHINSNVEFLSYLDQSGKHLCQFLLQRNFFISVKADIKGLKTC